MRVVRALLAIVALVVVSGLLLMAISRFSDFYDRSPGRARWTVVIVAGILVAAVVLLVLHYGFPVC